MIVSWKKLVYYMYHKKGDVYMYGKLAWEKYNDEQINDIMTFNEGYKNYITKGKQNGYVSVKLLNWQWHMDIKS
mgnify:CR=1 FL=1